MTSHRSIVPYEAVAEEYLRSSFKPTTRIARTFGKPYSTASRWVKECRRRGLLPAVPCGWVTTPKLDAVARALDVSPDDLREAVLAHAGGDLRISGEVLRSQPAQRTRP